MLPITAQLKYDCCYYVGVCCLSDISCVRFVLATPCAPPPTGDFKDMEVLLMFLLSAATRSPEVLLLCSVCLLVYCGPLEATKHCNSWGIVCLPKLQASVSPLVATSPTENACFKVIGLVLL